MRELTIDIANEALVLMPERAVFWRRADTLIIADTRWGAASALPASAMGSEPARHEARLDALLERTRAHRIVFLGDLFYGPGAHTQRARAEVEAWRTRHRDVDMLLVRGNRDRHADDPPAELSIHSTDGPLIEPPFVLTHYPAPSAAGYVLAGYHHPCVRAQRTGQEPLPCFWFDARVGVLPAFGAVVEPATVSPDAGRSIYIIDHDSVRLR